MIAIDIDENNTIVLDFFLPKGTSLSSHTQARPIFQYFPVIVVLHHIAKKNTHQELLGFDIN
jgi:hypothetical protein